MIKVGIIGLGAIAKDVIHYIQEKKVENVELTAILVRDKNKYNTSNTPYSLMYEDEDAFFDQNLDIIIETAGHQAVYQYAVKSLSSGSDFLTVSVGAFADPNLFNDTKNTAAQFNRHLIIPSAAIAGLDRISAASLNTMSEVKLITSKPPNAWRGTIAEELIDLDSITQSTCIFKGTARESSKLFPESTNVSAALSIAGIGFDKTIVEVYADPHITKNTHKICARGFFGEVDITVQNTPSKDNPKSGYIVAMSICNTLKNISSPVKIGV